MIQSVRFKAVEDFSSDELQSQYCAGLLYTIRPEDARLREVVMQQWLPQGKVVLVEDSAGASLSGS
jgi:hypothetical protein